MSESPVGIALKNITQTPPGVIFLKMIFNKRPAVRESVYMK